MITPVQGLILDALTNYEYPASYYMLSKAVGLPIGIVDRNVEELLEQGYVMQELTKYPEERPVRPPRRVLISSKGRDAMEEAKRHWREQETALRKGGGNEWI